MESTATNNQRQKPLKEDLLRVMSEHPTSSREYKRAQAKFAYWYNEDHRRRLMEKVNARHARLRRQKVIPTREQLQAIIDSHTPRDKEYLSARAKMRYHYQPDYRQKILERGRRKNQSEPTRHQTCEYLPTEEQAWKHISNELIEILKLTTEDLNL